MAITFPGQQIVPAESLPARIGRYQLVGRLAKGGMAEAFLALSGELPGLQTLVVVKRILPHLSDNEQFVRMFFDEARIGALLNHPNIARIIEVGRDGDGYFIAMEPVPGKPLSAILRRGARRRRPLSHAHAAYIVGQAARGLAYAHTLTDGAGRLLNVVHRDVSPENIVVSFEGAVKVIDFGVASALGRVSETLVGGLKGKVEYMSPEQAAGGTVDRRSDVFALGIVLWEAITGQRLFRRGTDLATMRAILDDPIPPPLGTMPVSPRLERIVMTALEKAPEDRFQDAQEMSLLLERHAYTTEGFDPAELVAHVKQLFPADHTGWKVTASAAVELGGARAGKVTATFPLSRGVDTTTGGPTLALHKRVRAATTETAPLVSWAAGAVEPPSDSGEASSAPGGSGAPANRSARARSGLSTRADAPLSTGTSVRSRGYATGALWLLLGAIGAATAFVWLRPRTAPPVVLQPVIDTRTIAAAPVSTPLVEPLPMQAPAPFFGPEPAATPLAPEPPSPRALPPLTPPVTASPPPAARPAPRAIARVVKPIARKRAVPPRAAVTAKLKPVNKPPAPANKPAAPAPAPAAPAAPAPKGPHWNDPFR